MKPVIGLTAQNEYQVNRKLNRLNYTYIKAVLEAGGIPIIIPVMEEEGKMEDYLDIVDGIIFTGGEDVSSLYFNEEPIKEVSSTDLDRDKSEMELFKLAYEKNIPMFGICRGLQLINIGLGGDIYQDLFKAVPDAIGHVFTKNAHEGHHTIKVEKDSILYEAFGKETLVVNSIHHQSIRKLAENLKVTSTASDGIIESAEANDGRHIYGVQWHPEAMGMKYKEFYKLFECFIEKCK